MAFYQDIPDQVLVIAAFPPSHFAAARHAAQLVHSLDKSGLKISTVTALGPAYCGKLIHFGPKRRFEPMLHQLLNADQALTIVFPQGLGYKNPGYNNWKSRRIEEFRRLKLTAKLAFKKPKIIIAYPTGLPKTTAILTLGIIGLARIIRPKSVRLVGKAGRGIALAAKILHAPQKIPDQTSAEQTLFRLAGTADNNRLTPTWFSKSIQNIPPTSPLGQDLKLIKKAIAQLAPLPLPFQKPLASPSANPLFDRIDTRHNQVPLSRFMMHLRQKFRMAKKFPLSNEEGRLALLRWYMREMPEKLRLPLPLPATSFDAFKTDCKKRANLSHVRGLQQPDTRDVILPSYLLALHRCFPDKYAKFTLDTNASRIAFAFQIIVDHGRFQAEAGYLGESLIAYFNAPIEGNADNISRFVLFCAVLGHAPAKTQKCLQKPWRSDQLSQWVGQLAQRGYPMLANFSPPAPAAITAKLTITGTELFNTGLGRNQMMSMTALKNIQVSKPVFLHHTNADDIPMQLCKHNQTGAFHIGFLLWELDKLPKSHQMANRLLDEIWAPSSFVQGIYQTAFKRPITMIGKGFDLPDVAAMDLSVYGIEKNQTVFLSCFDMHSSVSRKNPLAAVRAFQAAFPKQQNVRFILKTTPPPKSHWGDPCGQMASIKKLVSRDPRIILDQRLLSFAQLMSLIRATDCTVSPHRAEGFGYFPAYALKYAKPVIATDYSGTRDFCTKETSFPVGYTLRDVKKTESIYPVSGAKWAEIDQKQFVNALQQVAQDQSAAALRGRIGQELMQGFYSSKALANRYKQRLRELDLTGQALSECSYKFPALDAYTAPGKIDRPQSQSPVPEP